MMLTSYIKTNYIKLYPKLMTLKLIIELQMYLVILFFTFFLTVTSLTYIVIKVPFFIVHNSILFVCSKFICLQFF